MRIVILAVGSRGDYQPILAVARGLQARGHEVGVTATSDFVDTVSAAGVRVEEIRFDLMRFYREDALHRQVPHALPGQFERLRDVAVAMAPAVRRSMTDLWRRYDGLVTTAISASWPSLLGGPTAKSTVSMMFIPTVPTPWGDASFYSVRAGWSPQNLLAGLRTVGPSARMALAYARNRREWIHGLRHIMGTPTFVANSPQIVTPRRVAGRQIHCTGYPFYDAPEGAGLPAEVDGFLAAGPPPIYAGFGSHTLPAVREALAHTADAALRLGHRVIIQRGSGLEDDNRYDGRVLFVGDVHHDLLFPRTAIIVHHGGAGTVAQSLRAGRPQVVLPFMLDQPFFARRVHEIGVGAAPVPAAQTNHERLRSALTTALSAPVARRAAEVAQAVRREDGVSGAVAVIERELLRAEPVNRFGNSKRLEDVPRDPRRSR